MTTLVAIMCMGVDVTMTVGIMIGTVTTVRIVPTSIMMLVRMEVKHLNQGANVGRIWRVQHVIHEEEADRPRRRMCSSVWCSNSDEGFARGASMRDWGGRGLERAEGVTMAPGYQRARSTSMSAQ